MNNTKLQQAIALSGGSIGTTSISLDDVPTLEGPRQDQIQRFNEQFKEWKRKTEIRLSQQIVRPTSG